MATPRQEKAAKWLADRLEMLRHLTKPTDAQRLLLTLADNPRRTEQENKEFAALVEAEKAEERAEKARSAARAIVQERTEAERKARNHRLIARGGLSEIAGLLDQDPGEHLGALLDIARVLQSTDERQIQKRAAWKTAGDALLAERQETRSAARAKTKPTDPGRDPGPVRQTGAVGSRDDVQQGEGGREKGSDLDRLSEL